METPCLWSGQVSVGWIHFKCVFWASCPPEILGDIFPSKRWAQTMEPSLAFICNSTGVQFINLKGNADQIWKPNGSSRAQGPPFVPVGAGDILNPLAIKCLPEWGARRSKESWCIYDVNSLFWQSLKSVIFTSNLMPCKAGGDKKEVSFSFQKKKKQERKNTFKMFKAIFMEPSIVIPNISWKCLSWGT